MDNNSKKTSGSILSLGNIITAILLIAVIIGYLGSQKDWFRFTNISGENTVEIGSMEQLSNSVNYKISLPDFVNSAIVSGSNPKGTVKKSNFSSFTVDTTLIGTCKFVGYGVDPLSLKDLMYSVDANGNTTLVKAVSTTKYSVEGNDITYIEYVYNLPGFENCTLILWSDSSANYSMLFGDKVTEEVILENWNIDKESLTEFTGDNVIANDTTSNDDIDLNTIESEHISISLPNGFELMESDGYDIYILNGKMLLAVMYTEGAVESDNFAGSGEISISDTVVLRYSKENPFSSGTSYYSTYNKVLESIGKIAGSIEYKK